MSKEIKPIGKESIHRICSGQVVLNLATAVKELVENSLDAKATIIEIRLKEFGSEIIEVTDNGTGVHPNNFEALALKHHTSKLNDFADLMNVNTFGFRGEALSSLCALSELSVITRHETEKCGSKIIFDTFGHIKDIVSIARQVGTTVLLSNIFSTLPVRYKEFHRNLKREFVKMTQLLSAYCLVATGVKIICVNQNKNGSRNTLLCTQGSNVARENISCIFGSKQLNSLVEIVEHKPDEDTLKEIGIFKHDDVADMFKLKGFISSCEHGSGRSSADRQFCYINSRPCDLSKVVRLINEIYHQYNQHQFPFIFLDITVAKESVDINVTPDKRLLFLTQEKLLLATVKSTLLKMYESIPSTYKMNIITCPVVSETPSITCPVVSETPSTDLSHSTFSVLNKWRHPLCTNKINIYNLKRAAENMVTIRSKKQMKLDGFSFSKMRAAVSVENVSTSENYDKSILRTEFADSVESSDNFNESTLTTEFDNNIDSCLEDDINKLESEDIILKDTETEINRETHFAMSAEDNAILNEEKCIENNIRKDISNQRLIDGSRDGENTLKEITEVNEEFTCSEIGNKILHPCDNKKSVVDETKIVDSYKGRKCVQININLADLKNTIFGKNKKQVDNIDETGKVFNKFHIEIDPNKNQLAESELDKEITKDMFPKMSIVGQFNLGFIITRLGPDLFIIDQHATDEKYNFEILQKTTTIQNQKLVIPQNLELSAVNEYILLENINIMKKNGFEFDIDHTAEPTKRVKLTSIPISQNWHFSKEDVDELLFMLQDSPNTLCRPSRVRTMFASRACRKSVMIGTALSISDMRRLVNHMGVIEQPWNCPHGRPTMRHLINLALLG